MNDKFDDLIDRLKDVPPPAGLTDRLVAAVHSDRRRSRTVTALLFSALGMTAPAVFISLRLLISDASASSLGPLLDLALTDWQQVRTSGGSWALAVFESLPVLSLALTLGALFALVILLNRILTKGYIKNKHMKEAI